MGTATDGIETPESPKAERPVLHGRRILVIDDNPLNAKILNGMLTGMGCIVHHQMEAGSAPMGRDEDLALIILNLHLNEADGTQVAREIRTCGNPEIAGLPIVALSATPAMVPDADLEALGIQAILSQPFPSEVLQTTLCKILNPDSEMPTARGETDSEAAAVPGIDPLAPGQKREIIEETLDLFKRNTLEFIGRMRACLQLGTCGELPEAVHQVVPGLDMFGAQGLLRIADAIRLNARAAEPDILALKELYNEFLAQYTLFENGLDDLLDRY